MADKIEILVNIPEENIDIIFDHFSNHNIELIKETPYYRLILSRNPFLYCEDFTKALDFLKITKYEVLDYYYMDDQSIFSLLESWIPYGWFCFFASRKEIPKKLTIIHLDDHSDLMSPYISVNSFKDDKNWKDILTGQRIDIKNPETIKKATESGAITLGSILTLLVYAVENITILHLKQNSITTLKYIQKHIQIDPLIVPKQYRMSIKLLNGSSANNKQHNKYFRSSNINELLENIQDDSDIFLHIDMDFFNNRYNGSTDWYMEKHHDPDINQQKAVINSFCNAITKSGLIDKIVHVSIGLSPSFYPSQYWDTGLITLINTLKKCNLAIVPVININGVKKI